ncbi:MAG TPA: peptidase T [Treponema sp.]|nr:peptidase T [Treponema sp.]
MNAKDRFLKYVKFDTTSDENSSSCPSTQGQTVLLKALFDELVAMGAQARQDKNGYVYALIPATKKGLNKLCFIAHTDTSPAVSGSGVNPKEIAYNGGDVVLENGVVISVKDTPELMNYVGKDLIVTDGKTLLGADDKAGVAEIVSCLEYLLNHPELKHPAIEVIFSPDEETGHGMDKVPLELLKSKCAYTVDGGHIGELETECFNAFRSDIVFKGNATHTGTARGTMVNAISMASSFVANLPAGERPETTDGRQGFFAPISIEGSIEESKVSLLLRDFSSAGMEKRKSTVELLAKTVSELFGGKAEVLHTQQYLNMKENLDKNPKVAERLISAYKASGIEPIFTPIRGGTDGSRLTEMGIPCPNIFTGGHNFHSCNEWASLDQMIKAVEVLVHLCCGD